MALALSLEHLSAVEKQALSVALIPFISPKEGATHLDAWEEIQSMSEDERYSKSCGETFRVFGFGPESDMDLEEVRQHIEANLKQIRPIMVAVAEQAMAEVSH